MPSDVPRPGALRAAGSEAAGRARSAGRLGGRAGRGPRGRSAGRRPGCWFGSTDGSQGQGWARGSYKGNGWVGRACPAPVHLPPPAPRAPASSSPRAPPLQRRVVTTRCSLATRGSGGPVVCWAGPARGLRGAGRGRAARCGAHASPARVGVIAAQPLWKLSACALIRLGFKTTGIGSHRRRLRECTERSPLLRSPAVPPPGGRAGAPRGCHLRSGASPSV